MFGLNKTIIGAVALVAISASSASAAIIQTSTPGPFTDEAGAVTFNDFDGIDNAAIGSVSGGLLNIGTDPLGGGNWLATSAGVAPIEVTFAAPVDYFGFLWGTKDFFNDVELFNGATSLGTFGSIGGFFSTFVSFEAETAGDVFDRVVLSSGFCCFETDNLAARLAGATPVPEPSGLALLGLGLLGLGAMARRRMT